MLNISEFFLAERVREGMGDRVAVRTAQGETTYREVDAWASRFGHVLADLGIRPGDRVIVALPDGLDYVAAFFGVLRCGAVVVMVNPHLPPGAIRYFFEYTGASLALVDREAVHTFSHVARVLEERGPRVVDVTTPELRASLEAAPERLAPHASDAEDPAVWLFSGGTTGQPKAVVQPHRSFVNTTRLYGQGVLGLTPDDVTLSVPKLFFGYATGSNLLFPFSVGASTALFPERCTAEALFEALRRFRPTVLVNVPTMVNHMLAHPQAGREDLASLRLSTSAGEALPPELHARWNEAFGVELLDGLGTAEMWHVFLTNRPGDVRPGTLGREVEGFNVRVRDENGEDCAPGEMGRLWVQGGSLGLGYHDRPEQTAHAFRGDWFVSGDMVSMDEEGWVTYRGRGDDMLKVSGKWLSPAELEDCLLGHPGVLEVAVVGARSREGLVKPRAYVVLDGATQAGDVTTRSLQEWVKGRLQPYKYPREVVFLDALPRTHLGKVDRGRLARE